MFSKQPSKIHKENIFVTSLRKTLEKGFYETAKKELAPIPYAIRNRTLFLFSRYYTTVFHVISAITALFGVFIVAKISGGLDNIGTETRLPLFVLYTIATLTGLLLTMLIVWVEIIKNNQAQTVFKSIAIGETVRTINVGGLLVALLLNIFVSAVGGATLSYQTSDKSLQIDKSFISQKDSVQNTISLQIATYDNTITYYEDLRKARQRRSKKWGLEKNETDLLNKAISQKSKLEDLQEQKISALQSSHTNLLVENTQTEKQNGLISAIVMLCLELLALWCYYYRYQYYKFCEIEDANFQILEVDNAPTVTLPNVSVQQDNAQTEAVVNTLKVIVEQLKNIPIQTQAVRYPMTLPTNKNSPIGFPIPKKDSETDKTPITKVETPIEVPNIAPIETEKTTNKTVFVFGKGYHITCPICGTKVWKKRETAVFCTDKCRLQHHKNIHLK